MIFSRITLLAAVAVATATTAVMAAVIGAASLTVSAQQFVLSSRDRAQLLVVDFVALTADGMPVATLTPADITIKLDGSTRPIRSLEYVSAVSDRVESRDIPPPYGSNLTTAAGRALVLVVDEPTIRASQGVFLQDALRAFVATLGPDDRVALVTVPYGGLQLDLTADHQQMLTAVSTLTGQAAAQAAGSDACLTRTTLSALSGTLNSLRSTGDAPVAVIFFSSQMAVPRGPQLMTGEVALGLCELTADDFQQVGMAASRARAQFFVIHPDMERRSASLAGLEHLAGVTGAPLFHLSDVANRALARVTTETSGYYIARVESLASDTDGQLRRLSIDATVAGVTVNHREHLSVVKPEARFVNAPAPVPLDLMRQAQVFRDLPLRVAASVRRTHEGLQLVVMFDAPVHAAQLSDAMVGAFDADGRLVQRASFPSVDLAAGPNVTALSVPAGTYRVRVAAVEPPGVTGSADITVDATLTEAGPLRLSSLMLGLSRAGVFAPQFEFSDEPVVVAWLELYGGQAGVPVGVAFELASTAHGPAMLTTSGVTEATSDADRFVVTAAIPIEELPPGDYVVRATVTQKGHPAGQVVRTMRKTPK
ncbi:MAG: hypothetical protein HQ485_08265 [Acidobacteria bacterium]|nr:hypothetical protein [Acidobacteriota bacterium]